MNLDEKSATWDIAYAIIKVFARVFNAYIENSTCDSSNIQYDWV
jgi:hypothetical protein